MCTYSQQLFRQVGDPSSKVVTKLSKGAKPGSNLRSLVSFIVLKVTLSSDRWQLLSTVPHCDQQSLESDPRPNTVAFGRKLIMDKRKCQQQTKMDIVAAERLWNLPDDEWPEHKDNNEEDKINKDGDEDEGDDEGDREDETVWHNLVSISPLDLHWVYCDYEQCNATSHQAKNVGIKATQVNKHKVSSQPNIVVNLSLHTGYWCSWWALCKKPETSSSIVVQLGCCAAESHERPGQYRWKQWRSQASQ